MTLNRYTTEATAIGRTFIVLTAGVHHIPEKPHEMEVESIDQVKHRDVIVCACNRTVRTAYWGELIATCCRPKRARGAVMDSPARDTKMLKAISFPAFVRGIFPVDSMGRSEVVAYNVPIECGGVRINPGHIVFGDIDGVLIIPAESIEEMFMSVEEETVKEDETRKELCKGSDLAKVLAKQGVLQG